MKKTIIAFFFTGWLFAMFSFPAAAFDGWEAAITVTSGNIESRFSFGQKPEATDLADGLYDVPAMLSGSLKVYSQTEEGSFWRDIRAMDSDQDWQLIITSETGGPVSLVWNPADFPAEATVKLIDALTDKKTDMKITGTYTLEDTNNALLLIEVTNK